MKIRSLILAVIETIIKVVVVGVLVYYLYQGTLLAYEYGYSIFLDKPKSNPPGIDILVTIPEGSSVLDVGKVLEKRGVIENANIFFIQERLSDYHGKLKDGNFNVNTSMTANEIMAVLSGSVVETAPEDEALPAQEDMGGEPVINSEELPELEDNGE